MKNLLFIFALALCVLRVSSQDPTCLTVLTDATYPGSLTKLQIDFPTNLPIQISYESSTTSNVEVEVTWCSTDSTLIDTFNSLAANISNDVTEVLLYLGLTDITYSTSAATKGATASLSLLLTAFFASFILFPKRRVSAVVILAICIALCAPSISADAANNVITVKVSLPSTITTVCENSHCFTPNTTSSGSSSTTGDSSTSGDTVPTLSPTDPTGPTDTPVSTTGTPVSTTGTPVSTTDTPVSTTGTPASTTGTPASTTGTPASTTGTPASTTGTPASTTGSPTDAPTDPTNAPTYAPTPAPTLSPASIQFNLRVLIFSAVPKSSQSTIVGVDFATLAFASVGMPYDYVQVSSTTDLTTSLSTAGVGMYSGIVTVYQNGKDPLSTAQNALINAYQLKYGVKWVIVGCTTTSSVSGLTGIISADSVVDDEFFYVSLAPEFAQYGQFLNQSISVYTNTTVNWADYTNTPAPLLVVKITATSSVTPMLMAYPSSGATVAAAAIKMADGTQQLRYFLFQSSDYIHSMAYAGVMVNWISPGGLFIGARRITFSVQPDDLFLGSYIWDIATHSNPVLSTSSWYRITDYDLQGLADFFDTINPTLPTGSYVTVEWPTNFGGVNNSYYTRNEPDYLYFKALQLKDKFYYLSHTWDHPCTFDNKSVGYNDMAPELSKNIDFAPGYFQDRMDLWSSNSMITPCVTGLYNGEVLQAMWDNGIYACVSDESVTDGIVDYEPITPYHGVYSDVATNGFAGMYFVPRQALDTCYCAMTPAMVVDEYLTNRLPTDPILDFEGIIRVETMGAIQDKISFRHDPYMLHQTNAFQFTYNDPTTGTSYNTSLIALFMKRVIENIQLYYNLPIVTHQMDDLVDIFQQRQTMDACGITTTLGVDTNGQIVNIEVTGQSDCTLTLSGGVQLSGSTVSMETVGVETTATITLTAGVQQSFTLSTGINQN